MVLEIAVLGLVLLAIGLVFFSTVVTGASPLPSSPATRETMLAVLPIRIDGPIYELGSGWGGLAVALAHRYPDQSVRAFEVSVLPWTFAKVRRMFGGPRNLEFRYGDFRRADLTDAALVSCYLTPPVMARLKPKLEAELKPGALVLCNTFAVRGWQPTATAMARDRHRSEIFLYKIGG
jgi:hypothetical protein